VLPIKPDTLNDLTLIEGVRQAIAAFAGAFCLRGCDDPERIAKGLFSLDEFHRWFEEFSAGRRTCGAEMVVHTFVRPF
jgi:hypothetical protein